ncbi:unnamed protein product [Prunus armeniaca]|uniref:Uncharacterized protein n=1 Tax=Prunus armeniaca TaxID=36596 RepID=A0A6J5WG43_PRUAR|nr:unnamed protein product [Prunus armeniaca]
MWDFVQVAVVVTRVLEIRFSSLTASAVGSFNSSPPSSQSRSNFWVGNLLRQREDWVMPSFSLLFFFFFFFVSPPMIYLKVRLGPLMAKAWSLPFGKVPRGLWANDLQGLGPRYVSAGGCNWCWVSKFLTQHVSWAFWSGLGQGQCFGRASFAGGVISFCSLVANWDPSKILSGLAWVAWCRVCLSFGKIPLGRRLGSARGVGSDSTSVEWVWRKPHDLRTGLGPPYWLGSGYTFPKNSWVALEPCLVEASALLGAGPSIEKDFGKENWSWARDSCRSAGTGVSCLWQGLGSAKFSFGASVNGFFSKWVSARWLSHGSPRAGTCNWALQFSHLGGFGGAGSLADWDRGFGPAPGPSLNRFLPRHRTWEGGRVLGFSRESRRLHPWESEKEKRDFQRDFDGGACGQSDFRRHSVVVQTNCWSVANLAAWCSGPRGCASTRDVLLLDAVRLCAGVPARSTVRRGDDEVRVEDGLNVAPVLHSTPNQAIVTE